jgi:hypothetical protein
MISLGRQELIIDEIIADVALPEVVAGMRSFRCCQSFGNVLIPLAVRTAVRHPNAVRLQASEARKQANPTTQ